MSHLELSPAELERYQNDGYFQRDGVFSLKESERMRSAFRGLIANPPEGVGVIREQGSDVVRSVMGWQRDEVLGMFARDSRILTPVGQLLGGSFEFHQTKYNPKAPLKGEKWDPHRGDTFWCWKDGVPGSEGLISVFIAVTDQTEENGAVYAWKGSHVVTLEDIRPDMLGLHDDSEVGQDTAADLSLQIDPERLRQFDQDFERVQLVGAEGTVWFLNSALLHASEANRSTEVRELVANVFRRMDCPPRHPRKPAYLCELG